MAKLSPIYKDNGEDSLNDFLQELMEKHPNEGSRYLTPLITVLKDFEKYGSRINLYSSKNFPPFKPMKGEEFAELRTKKCRYFIFHTGNDVWIGLHGYEKQSGETPKHEIIRARKEIQQWKESKKTK